MQSINELLPRNKRNLLFAIKIYKRQTIFMCANSLQREIETLMQ